MASAAAAIGDGVTAWLNGNTQPAWAVTGWMAARTWAPDLDLSTVPTAQPAVEVAPEGPDTEELETRETDEVLYTVYVGVRQRYDQAGDPPNTWVDPLAWLAEQIGQRLVGLEVAGVGKQCVCEQTTVEPLIDPAALRERRVASSVITARFRVWR